MTYDEFMNARDLNTGETFRRFAARTGMSNEDIQAGYRWQKGIEQIHEQRGVTRAEPVAVLA